MGTPLYYCRYRAHLSTRDREHLSTTVGKGHTSLLLLVQRTPLFHFRYRAHLSTTVGTGHTSLLLLVQRTPLFHFRYRVLLSTTVGTGHTSLLLKIQGTPLCQKQGTPTSPTPTRLIVHLSTGYASLSQTRRISLPETGHTPPTGTGHIVVSHRAQFYLVRGTFLYQKQSPTVQYE
jgi:hypothetical protein